MNDFEMDSREGKQLSILDLSLEATASIIEKLDFPTRLALRNTCRRFNDAEKLAKFDVEELGLCRTGDGEFTLSVKDRRSDTWILVRNVNGNNVRHWQDNGEFIDGRKRLPSDWTNSPLGEMAVTLQEYLNRSIIDDVAIDGFHYTDTSIAQLCGILRNKSFDTLCLSGPISTTTDSRLYEIVDGCPNLRRLVFNFHCVPKEIVLKKDLLLYAASRIEQFIVCSLDCPCESSETGSVDKSAIDDKMLIRLLSDKCYRLTLFEVFPLLSAEGIVAAIEHLSRRNEQNAGLTTCILPELHDSLWRLLGVTGDLDDIARVDEDGMTVISFSMVKTYEKLTSVFKVTTKKASKYCKVVIEKEAACGKWILIPN